jgi:enterochelin esterase family protein
VSETVAALEALREAEPTAVEAFLAARTFPAHEGRKTIFVYHGEADEVELIHWLYGLERSLPFLRVDGSDLWHLTLELPEASRVEYKLLVTRGEWMELVRDPLNPHEAHDPFGANSVCQVPGYEFPDWTLEDPEAERGHLEELTLASRLLGGERPLEVYLPPRFRPDRRYPLLIVHDGRDFLRFASLQTVLDNLISRFEIEPLVVALSQSPERLLEYGADPAHADFLALEVMPLLEQRYPLRPEPRHRGLLGSSFGAVAALHAAWTHPGLWDRLLLQSGSFAFTDIGTAPENPVIEQVVQFMNALREDPGRPAERVYLSCGQYEALIYENRSLVPVLQRAGIQLRYREARDGHNWENWRDRLREGLCYLFPGPLWMVYE